VDRIFTVREKPLRVFFGAQNLINRKNIASYIWNRSSNQIQVNEQIGVFPLVGIDWTF